MIGATHTSERGYLYRVRRRNLLVVFDTGVDFWDEYCNKWRCSIMWKRDLKEIIK